MARKLPRWRTVGGIAVVAAAVAVVLLGSRLAAGGPPPPDIAAAPSLTPAPDVTPPPPPPCLPSQPPDLPDQPCMPEPGQPPSSSELIMMGLVPSPEECTALTPVSIDQVPVPPGGELIVTGIGPPNRAGAIRSISGGSRSFIVFDSEGIIDGYVAPEDEKDFQPTLEAVRALACARRQPPIMVDGVEIPVPRGAILSGPVIADPPLWGPGGPTRGIHRGNSFVLFNSQGILQAEIAPEDQANFQPTLDALQRLAGNR